MYLVISSGDDGTNIRPMNKAELEKAVNEKYWGEAVTYLKELPQFQEGLYFDGVLIMRIEVVVPEPVTTVTKYVIN